jgi:DNA-binding transcriptional LysR family regulator
MLPVMTRPTLIDGQVWSDLRLFLEVARCKSFNKAAAELDTSHPTIARAVRRLEQTLGMPLLTTWERGVELTKAGEALAKELKKIDAKVDQTIAALTRK